MDVFSIITAVVAVWGAVLSTIIYLGNRKANRRTLSVSLAVGIDPYSQDRKPLLLTTVANPSLRTITVQGYELDIGNKRRLLIPNPSADVKLPHTLQGGQSCHFWIPISDVACQFSPDDPSGIARVSAVVNDAVGGVHRSAPLVGNVSDWLSSIN